MFKWPFIPTSTPAQQDLSTFEQVARRHQLPALDKWPPASSFPRVNEQRCWQRSVQMLLAHTMRSEEDWEQLFTFLLLSHRPVVRRQPQTSAPFHESSVETPAI